MKKLSVISIAIIAACTALPSLAQDVRSDEAGQWFVGPRIGLMGTDSDRQSVENNQLRSYDGGLDTTFGGIELGHNFTKEWGYRVYYDLMRSNAQDGGSASGKRFGTDILYNFTDNLYGGIGINATEIDDISNRFLRLSGGYKTYLTNDVAMTFEAALQQSDTDLTEFMFQTSLRYYFGGGASYTAAPAKAEQVQKPAEPVKPVVVADIDSDNDGVLDSKDKCPNTRAGYKVDADGCVMYENQTVTKSLVVNFGFDSAVISADGKADIADTAAFLKDYPQLDIVIEGHTDDRGAASYNLSLSERRAKAVGESLVTDFGIDAARVSTVGYGEGNPLVPNDSDANRAKNRRIEARMSVTTRVPVEN
ncbi:MAG: Outer membrane porin F [Pseudidiomarina mangrovi]|nr:MAG: Outer membrane porin F [Pseudidiomarina mangrovi]